MLIFRSPEIAVAVGLPAGSAVFSREVYAGRTCFLSFLEWLTFKRRVRETVVVSCSPLGATLFALDLGGVDETPFLYPLGCPSMGFVIPDVLYGSL